MDFIQHLAEQRIEAAIQAGELEGLPGSGKPLELNDDALVPPELRMAWRILKNAGHCPPEVEALRDVAQLERALAQAEDDEEKRRFSLKISLIRSRLAARGLDLRLAPGYEEKLAARLGGGR